MAFSLGLDLGSTTAKAVLLDGAGRLMAWRIAPAGIDARALALKLRDEVLAEAGAADIPIVATGYGRGLVDFAQKTVTEITCHARGVRRLHPDARSIVDVGGQDAKAIRLGPDGRVEDFAMNDRCAAGTGSFLEMAARRLGRALDSLSALPPGESPEISSTCAVFAESEMVGLLARGFSPEAVLRGIHRASARRIAALARQIRPEPPVVFSGGVALNETLRRELEAALGLPLRRSDHPQLTAAIGAALLADSPPSAGNRVK
jgi:(R)-2-hydroxyacyl-CoA dehydratese activating ATPase